MEAIAELKRHLEENLPMILLQNNLPMTFCKTVFVYDPLISGRSQGIAAAVPGQLMAVIP